MKKTFSSGSLSEKKFKERYSILLVEENEELCSFLIQVLSEEYNIDAIFEVESACETIRNEQPDVILSGGTFKNMSGDEFCLLVKSDVKTAHIPVILLKDPVSMENDNQRVADCCLTLPLDISRLRAEIDILIFNRGIIRKRYIKLVLGADDMLGPDIEKTLPSDEQTFIGRVRKLIEENFSNPDFNVDVLSAAMNMSRSGFYTKMKMITNQAPADYIRTVKLNRALILLISKKYTVTEVAELTGFSDPKYFREVFKKYYGESPKKFVDNL
ncbi:helix-turn-helix domain-containing protein [Bacteroides sp.]